MQTKRIAIIIIASMILSAMVSPLRGGYISLLGLEGIFLSSFVNFILYGVLTFLVITKMRDKVSSFKVMIAMLLGVSILIIPVHIIYFYETLDSLGGLITDMLGILVGYGVYKVNSKYGKIVLTGVSLAFIFWFAYIGYPMWIHKNSYGSFTGKMDQKVENPIVFQSVDGKILPLSDFNCKYLVLDFWTSTCGYCFDAFPKVQKQYEELKANKDIELYSVFCMIKERNETPKIGDELLQKRGYTFPRLAIDVKDPVLKEIEVTAFPKVIIITPSGNIVFRGNIESAIRFTRKLK